MKRLWAPWRMDYIDDIREALECGGAVEGDECFLCRAAGSDDDRKSLVFLRRKLTFAILNRYPYNNGHTLIVPLAHKGDLRGLEREEMLELMETTSEVMDLLSAVMSPEGFNVGLNFGRCGGAGCPGHLHMHIVPRWGGDTNFMLVLADTKIIPQSLDDLYDRLLAALADRQSD